MSTLIAFSRVRSTNVIWIISPSLVKDNLSETADLLREFTRFV